MDNLKPKEPLLAVMLSAIITGLGQIYAGKVKRGILFFFIPLILIIPLMLYLLQSNTTTNPSLLLVAIIGFGYGMFVLVDAYRCTKEYNIRNNLSRNITADKRILLIVGIIFFGSLLNPSKIIALYIRNNVVQAYKIPTKTNAPTLLQGDLILVDKVIYKKSEPKRGDFIVFIYPEDTKKNFVMRLVGFPGETIEIKNGAILINGEVLHEPAFANKYYYNRGDYAKEGQVVKIPANDYIVLGDNSASSKDSRYWGFVPKKYLIGKAYKIYYPFSRSGPIK